MGDTTPRVSGGATEAPYIESYVNEPGVHEELVFFDPDGTRTRQYRRLDRNGYPTRDSFTVVTTSAPTGWHYDLATTGRLPCPLRNYRTTDPESWGAVREQCSFGELSDPWIPPRDLIRDGAALAINRRFQDYGPSLAALYAGELTYPPVDEPPFELRSDWISHEIDPKTGRMTTTRYQSYSRVLAEDPPDYNEILHINDRDADGTPDHVMAIRRRDSEDAERYFEVKGRNSRFRRGMLDLFQPFLSNDSPESRYFSFGPAEFVYFESGDHVRAGDPLFDIRVGNTIRTIRADRGGRISVYETDPSYGAVDITIDHTR